MHDNMFIHERRSETHRRKGLEKKETAMQPGSRERSRPNRESPEETAKNQRLLDYGSISLAAVLWGFVGILVRWVNLPGQEPVVVFWRELIGAVTLIILIIATRRWDDLKVPRMRWLLLASSCILAVHWTLLFKAYDRLPISDAIFLVYLAPILVAMLAPVLLKEKLERTTLLALAISLGGMTLISFGGGAARHLDGLGVIYALLAAVLFAFLILVLKKLREGLPTLTISLYEIVIGTLILLPFAAAGGYQITAKGWASIAVLGVILVAFTSIIYVHAARGVKAQHIGILAYLEPVSATLLAALFLGEHPGWNGLVGGLMIIAAGILVVLRAAPESASSDA